MTTRIGESNNAVALAMELQRARSQLTIAYKNLMKYGEHLPHCRKRPIETECECGFHQVYLNAATEPEYPTIGGGLVC